MLFFFVLTLGISKKAVCATYDFEDTNYPSEFSAIIFAMDPLQRSLKNDFPPIIHQSAYMSELLDIQSDMLLQTDTIGSQFGLSSLPEGFFTPDPIFNSKLDTAATASSKMPYDNNSPQHDQAVLILFGAGIVALAGTKIKFKKLALSFL